ncbi:MAG: outer membrane beta-barrel protein [Bacteroidota bacterium]
MKSFFTICIALLLGLTLSVNAQQKTGAIKGKSVDLKTKKPIDYASFAVKNVKDSTVAAMGATTPDGAFSAKGLTFGRYKFYLAVIGYKPILKAFELTAEKPMVDFGDVEMEESAIMLKDVLITNELLPILIKKDTVEFSADAFKTQADASVEDLLKVVQGMEVDKDGNITYNGKKIDRVTVGGKDFFGNDPKMATQNLPKDIVSKLQVIEKKTDDAIFKGIDDGKRENVLNIELKDDKKKGYFGNTTVGKADANLYDASLNLNRFNDKRQLSFIGLANNINKTSFSFNDLSDFLGGNIFGSGLVTGIVIDAGGAVTIGMNGENVSSGNSGGGINDNKGFGVNFNDEWGKNKKLPNKISFNYMGNRNYGIKQSLSSRLNLLGQDSYFNENNNEATSTTTRHRFSMKLDIPLDSMNKLQISPGFGYSSSAVETTSIFSSYTQNGQQPINDGNSLNNNNSKSPGFSGKILYNKRFNKKGRNLSLSANGSYSNAVLDGLNVSNITIHNGGALSSTLLDQLIDQTSNGNGYSISADFSEPLNKKLNLAVNYSYQKRSDVIERVVYDYNMGTTRYDLVNNVLSRNLQNFNKSNNVGLRLNYVASPKFNISLNANQKFLTLEGNNLMNNRKLSRDFLLIEPNFYLSYKMNKTSSLSVDGSRYINTPSISQLQPLTDNSNPLLITNGNPLLKPSANHNIGLRYNTFNPTKGNSFNFSLSFNQTDRRITNNSTLDPKTGIQTTFYDNVDGIYSFSARTGGSFKIKRLGLTFGPSANISSSKNVSFLNGKMVNSSSLAYGFGTSMNYTIGTALQFSNRINFNLRETKYDYDHLAAQNFTAVFNNLSLNVTMPYDFRFTLNSNLVYNANISLGNNNNTIHTANVSMEKMFFNKALGLKMSVSDVFNNSRNTSRFASDTYILESVNLGMRRYFLMSLTYRIKKFGAKEASNPLGLLMN